jgi:hypothetical protein
MRLGLTMQLGRLGWETVRVSGMLWRRFGVTGMLGAALVVLVTAAVLGDRWQMARLEELNRHAVELERTNTRRVEARSASPTSREAFGGRARLRAFEAVLLPHDDIPVLLQDLLRIANDEDVTLSRGEYRIEPDVVGGFLRYRMELPLQGPAPAVYRFIARALAEHKALALRSVHFRRARIETEDIEARVQWVALTGTLGERTQSTRRPSETDG